MIQHYEAGMKVKVIRNWDPKYEIGTIFDPVVTGDKVPNIQAGISQGRLMLIPVAKEEEAEYGTRFSRHHGRGKWDVIQGKKIHDGYLTKEEAEELVKLGSGNIGEK